MLSSNEREELRGVIKRERAMEIAKTRWWKDMSYMDVADVQLNQRLLCMEFVDFQHAVERALGRNVMTHEFSDRSLLLGEFNEMRSQVASGHRTRTVPGTIEVRFMFDMDALDRALGTIQAAMTLISESSPQYRNVQALLTELLEANNRYPEE